MHDRHEGRGVTGAPARIRRATPADADVLFGLQSRLDRESDPMLRVPGERSDSGEHLRERLADMAHTGDGSYLLLAHVDAEVVGCCEVTVAPHQRARHTGYVVIGVAEAFSERGIGHDLLVRAQTEARAKGLHRLELTVMEHNRRAVALYKRCGFRIEGLRRNALTVGDRAVSELDMGWLDPPQGATPGGAQAPAEVVGYDPEWPGRFARIRDRVTPALGPLGHRVEHVGSTAVPGLAAKPIVDADVVVAEPDVDRAVALLAALGYRHVGDLGITGREALLPPPDQPYHHLYVVIDGSAAHADHVDLRDYLLSHPAAAQRYARRKYELAHLLETDRDEYVRQKGCVVEELLRLARGGGSDVEP